MTVVYVLAADRTPLMPCSAVIARLLLKEGKAKVVRRTPFTIKLCAQPESICTQPLTLGVDTGSAVIGSAVADEQGNILYLSEIEVRNDIAITMQARARYRRHRRNRKTRYRKARWLNRRNSIKGGRFSPTMRSKIDAHLREIRFAQSLLPIASIVLETGAFDPVALKTRRYCERSGCIRRASTMALPIPKPMCSHGMATPVNTAGGNPKINGPKFITLFSEATTEVTGRRIC